MWWATPRGNNIISTQGRLRFLFVNMLFKKHGDTSINRQRLDADTLKDHAVDVVRN